MAAQEPASSPPKATSDDTATYQPGISALTPLSSLLTADMVAVFVGPKRKVFHLHCDLLCDRSAYFKAALLGNFKESETKELFLSDNDDAVFGMFVNWPYGTCGTVVRTPRTEDEFFQCLALIALSEKFMLEDLTNKCMDSIRGYYRKHETLVQAKDIEYVYENIQGKKVHEWFVWLAVI